jgi:branched-chain amino acid transport system permease protein
MFLVGVLIERYCLRRMIGQSVISIIMLTIGLGTLIRNLVGLIWGTQPQAPVPLFEPGSIMVLGAQVPRVYVWTLIVATILISAFVIYFRRSSQGVAMRAVAFHQDYASLSGISINRVFALSWGLAGAMAAILGGIDSIGGVILGGLIIGAVESMAGGYLDPLVDGGSKEVVGYIVLLLILMIRPYGLFGTPEVRKV